MPGSYRLSFTMYLDTDWICGKLEVEGNLTPETKATYLDPSEPSDFEITSVDLVDHPANDVEYRIDLLHFLTAEAHDQIEQRAREVASEGIEPDYDMVHDR